MNLQELYDMELGSFKKFKVDYSHVSGNKTPKMCIVQRVPGGWIFDKVFVPEPKFN